MNGGLRVSSVDNRGVRLSQNTTAMGTSVAEVSELPIQSRSHSLVLSYGSLWWIWDGDKHRHLYSFQVIQELKPRDHEQYRIHAGWVLEGKKLMQKFHKNFFLG